MGEMKRTMLATFLALLLLCTAIPVFAVPEYTDEQAQAEMEKELEEQGNALGWWEKPIPNRKTPEGNMTAHDIAPRLAVRYHWGITQWYNVKYEIMSKFQDSFDATWTDYFYLDDDTYTYCEQLHRRTGTINGNPNGQGITRFIVDNFESPKMCRYLDINIVIDKYDEIGFDHDSNPQNNKDTEYMLFWYITWQDEEPPLPPD